MPVSVIHLTWLNAIVFAFYAYLLTSAPDGTLAKLLVGTLQPYVGWFTQYAPALRDLPTYFLAHGLADRIEVWRHLFFVGWLLTILTMLAISLVSFRSWRNLTWHFNSAGARWLIPAIALVFFLSSLYAVFFSRFESMFDEPSSLATASIAGPLVFAFWILTASYCVTLVGIQIFVSPRPSLATSSGRGET